MYAFALWLYDESSISVTRVTKMIHTVYYPENKNSHLQLRFKKVNSFREYLVEREIRNGNSSRIPRLLYWVENE